MLYTIDVGAVVVAESIIVKGSSVYGVDASLVCEPTTIIVGRPLAVAKKKRAGRVSWDWKVGTSAMPTAISFAETLIHMFDPDVFDGANSDTNMSMSQEVLQNFIHYVDGVLMADSCWNKTLPTVPFCAVKGVPSLHKGKESLVCPHMTTVMRNTKDASSQSKSVSLTCKLCPDKVPANYMRCHVAKASGLKTRFGQGKDLWFLWAIWERLHNCTENN